MVNKMAIDKKIISEIKRYRSINQYLNEQDAAALPPAPGDEATIPPPAEPTIGAEPAATTDATTALPAEPQVVDVNTDTEVEKVDDSGESMESKPEGDGTEELEITDLVNAQKETQTKQDDYFGQLFGQLENLTSKLSEMDKIVDKINQLETKIEKYRTKTPEEKLELRSLDSYPFNQKLTDFFDEKEEDLEKSGKNEYVLTSNEVEDFSPTEIKKTFTPPTSDEDFYKI
jgi:hypothetical protein